jgi:ankyrin repeat protein
MTPLTSLINDYYFNDNYARPLYRIEKLLNHKNIQVNAVDEFGNASIHYAVKSSNFEVVKLLLAHKDINLEIEDKNGNTPYEIAEHLGNLRMAELLELAEYKNN